jgi:hypothetical protein
MTAPSEIDAALKPPCEDDVSPYLRNRRRTEEEARAQIAKRKKAAEGVGLPATVRLVGRVPPRSGALEE